MRDCVCVFCRNNGDVKSDSKLEQATEDHIVYCSSIDEFSPTLPLLPEDGARRRRPLKRTLSESPDRREEGRRECERSGRRRRAEDEGRSDFTLPSPPKSSAAVRPEEWQHWWKSQKEGRIIQATEERVAELRATTKKRKVATMGTETPPRRLRRRTKGVKMRAKTTHT